MENDVLVLRGMMVKPEFQRQGIGKTLLNAVDEHLGGMQCYCINPSHLTGFYSRIGFEQVETDVAPAFLVERMARYNMDGHECVMMFRR